MSYSWPGLDPITTDIKAGLMAGHCPYCDDGHNSHSLLLNPSTRKYWCDRCDRMGRLFDVEIAWAEKFIERAKRVMDES